MRSKLNEWVDQIPQFHELPAVEQIIRLVYFHTVEEKRETISRAELERYFELIDLPTPPNLPQLLAYLCGRGNRLITKAGEYSLRREVRQRIEDELNKIGGIAAPPKIGPAPAFEFPGRTFTDRKVQILLDEARKCYANQCWNACGILMRIILERALDSVDPRIKAAGGLKDRLNVGISITGLFSKTIVDTLRELKSAKLVGDIAAHHSHIVLDKHDVDLVAPSLKMLLKEIATI